MASALDAFQTQLDVTGQNIANVNTPGYTRQSVSLNEAQDTPISVGAMIDLGTGVTVSSVNRIRDMFLQASSVASSSDLGKANAQQTATTNVNSVILDPSTSGLSSDLSAFWNSWSALASDPSSSAAKVGVQQAGLTLASDVSTTYNGLQQLQTSETQQISQALTSVQQDLNQIATLNTQITAQQATGATPSALMDQRDQTVQNLSSMINVKVQTYSSGAYVISSGGVTLVDQAGARTIPTTINAATNTLTDASGTSIAVQSGQIAGLFSSINQLSSYQTSLDTLADTLRSSVNGVYASAQTPAGTGALFFNAGTGAASLALDSTGLAGPPVVNGVANDPTAIATGTTSAASDGSVATQIAGFSSTTIAGLGNQSMGDYYSQLVDQIGTDGQNANTAQTTQQAINDQITQQVQSVSGVNLDEEMSNMLQFQRSYSAAAQALTAFDQVTQSLLAILQ